MKIKAKKIDKILKSPTLAIAKTAMKNLFFLMSVPKNSNFYQKVILI